MEERRKVQIKVIQNHDDIYLYVSNVKAELYKNDSLQFAVLSAFLKYIQGIRALALSGTLFWNKLLSDKTVHVQTFKVTSLVKT